MKSKKTSVLAMTTIVAMLAVVSVAGIPESSAAKTKMYEVTITNLTPGQPITPLSWLLMLKMQDFSQ